MSLSDSPDSYALMQVEFGERARKFYQVCAETLIDGHIPPALIGKPLTYLYFEAISATHPQPDDLRLPITVRKLHTTPINSDTLYTQDLGDLSYTSPPKHVIQHRTFLADEIAATVIHDDMKIGEILAPGSVHARYTTFDQNNEVRQSTTTFANTHSRSDLESANAFAVEALEYVTNHGISTAGQVERLKDMAFDETLMIIAPGLEISRHLPLNGHEPVHFLRHYLEEMVAAAARSKSRLQQFTGSDLPPFAEKEKEILSGTLAAIARARSILDQQM